MTIDAPRPPPVLDHERHCWRRPPGLDDDADPPPFDDHMVYYYYTRVPHGGGIAYACAVGLLLWIGIAWALWWWCAR